MKNYLRVFLVIALMLGILALARGEVAWAGGAARFSNQAGLAQAGGFVWNDVDRDGLKDTGEFGIPDVTVNLYDSAAALVNTALTDAGGRFQFTDLAPGDYYVHFIPPLGYFFSPKDQIGGEALDSDADVATGETVLTKLVAGENTLMWDAGLFRSATASARPEPGTVKPPPAEVTICEQGDFSVGGVSTLNVKSLEPGYCLTAFLHNKAFAIGRIPGGAGTVLADATFVRVFYQGRLVYEVPEQDGSIEICYAVPPGMTGQIYFFDFYGPRFGKRSGQPAWEPLPTTVENGIACAPAQTSGAYALIGK